MHNSLVRYCVISCILLSLTIATYAQNCAIPQRVTLSSDPNVQAECVTEGTVIANFSVTNVQEVGKIVQKPLGFIRVNLVQKDKNSVIQLIVNESLCEKSASKQKTFIDETWVENIEVNVEFQCSDGHKKSTTFQIPIADQDTQPPIFQHSNYSVKVGPCVNGTHHVFAFEKSSKMAMACPLNFETPILVFDKDRDDVNAEIQVLIENADFIQYSSSILPTGSELLSGERSNYHISNVRLYLLESTFNSNDSFSFTLQVFGSLDPWGERLNSSTNITIYFGNGESENNTNTLIAPVFENSVYFASISNMLEYRPGEELLSLRPGSIKTSIPPPSTKYLSDFEYGSGGEDPGLEADDFVINYEISPLDFLRIDTLSGRLFFTNQLLDRNIKVGTELIYHVKAMIQSREFIHATVPLVIILPLQDNTTTTTTKSPSSATPPMTSPEDWTVNSTARTTVSTGFTEGESTTGFPSNPNLTSTTTESPHSTTSYETSESTKSPTSTTNREITELPETRPPITTTGPEEPTSEGWSTLYEDWSSTNVHSTKPSTEEATEDMATETSSTTSDFVTSSTTSDILTTPTDESSSDPNVESTTETNQDSTTGEFSTETITSGTSTTTDTSVSTTDDSWTTGSLMPTMPVTVTPTAKPTTPEIETPTTTPKEETCCEICKRIEDFECPNGDYDSNLYLPDPHSCEIYYMCVLDGNIRHKIPFSCDEGLIFCPEQQTCVPPGYCTCTERPVDDQCNSTTLKFCEPCQDCLRSNQPGNLCDLVAEEGLIADPKYYDIFHQCAVDDFGFRDCLHYCPSGLVFCEEMGQCDYSDTPTCSKVAKLPYRCRKCQAFYMQRGIFIEEYP